MPVLAPSVGLLPLSPDENITWTGINVFDNLVQFSLAQPIVLNSAILPALVKGNYAVVTIAGDDDVTEFETSGHPGTIIRLQFDAAVTLIHTADQLTLPGGVDYTTVKGDEFTFVESAETPPSQPAVWRCVAYTLVTGGTITGIAGVAAGTNIAVADPSGPIATVSLPADITNQAVNGVTLVDGGSSADYLSEDGTYTTPPDNEGVESISSTDTNIVVTDGATATPSLAMTTSAGSTNFLDGSGAYSVPSGTGLTAIIQDNSPELGNALDTNEKLVRWSQGGNVTSITGTTIELDGAGNFYDITGSPTGNIDEIDILNLSFSDLNGLIIRLINGTGGDFVLEENITGNISLPGGDLFTVSSGDFVEFVQRGVIFSLSGFQRRASPISLSDDLSPQLGAILDSNKHRIDFSQGADITVTTGNSLSLPDDGNSFRLTNTSSSPLEFFAFLTVPPEAGATFQIEFLSSFILQHDATETIGSLFLPTETDITTVVGDFADFKEEDNGSVRFFRCTNYQRLDGTALVNNALFNVVEDPTPELGGILNANQNMMRESEATNFITTVVSETIELDGAGNTYILDIGGTPTISTINFVGSITVDSSFAGLDITLINGGAGATDILFKNNSALFIPGGDFTLFVDDLVDLSSSGESGGNPRWFVTQVYRAGSLVVLSDDNAPELSAPFDSNDQLIGTSEGSIITTITTGPPTEITIPIDGNTFVVDITSGGTIIEEFFFSGDLSFTGIGIAFRLLIAETVVTFKHLSNGGNIVLPGGVDIVAQIGDFLEFYRTGGGFELTNIQRKASLSTLEDDIDPHLGGVFVTDDGTTNYQVQESQGIDLTAASTVVLGDDGNFFVVDGSSDIDDIGDSGKVGTQIELSFSGTPLLKEGVNLFLPNGGNDIQVEANDNAKFIQMATGTPATWECVSYTPVSGRSVKDSWNLLEEIVVTTAVSSVDFISVFPDNTEVTERLYALTIHDCAPDSNNRFLHARYAPATAPTVFDVTTNYNWVNSSAGPNDAGLIYERGISGGGGFDNTFINLSGSEDLDDTSTSSHYTIWIGPDDNARPWLRWTGVQKSGAAFRGQMITGMGMHGGGNFVSIRFLYDGGNIGEGIFRLWEIA